MRYTNSRISVRTGRLQTSVAVCRWENTADHAITSVDPSQSLRVQARVPNNIDATLNPKPNACSGGARNWTLRGLEPLSSLFLPFLLSLSFLLPSHPMSCPVPPIPSVTFLPSVRYPFPFFPFPPPSSFPPSHPAPLPFPTPSSFPPCREAAPLNPARGSGGSAISSPSGVWDGASAEFELTSGGNNFNYFPENQLTKFRAV